jgi:two-component system response regulator AtoC
MANLLIVEDDDSMRATLEDVFQKKNKNVVSVSTGEEALEEFSRNQPDLVLLDIRLPDTDGLTLLRKIKETAPDMLVIIMTAYPQIQTAIQAMVEKALETRQLKDEVTHLRRERAATVQSTKILGESAVIAQTRNLIRMVAETPKTPVLLSGESGTGKEIAANAIHYQSARADKALIKVNCSALPDNLLEDELFGHERGAFTDAKELKKGLFEMADGGTLFLDEIGEMSPSLQPKLLRILEGEPFRRVGGTREIRTDVRVIAATNRNLSAMVEEGTFRKDLYYRLKVMEIRLPTLHERREDIPLLVNHFIESHNREIGKKITSVTEPGFRMLLNYDWPGNVRELKNVIERAVILAEGEAIDRKHLPLELCQAAARENFKAAAPVDMDLTLEDLEREYILQTVRNVDGNRSIAARKLGISRSTLIERLKRYDFQ